MIVPGCYEVTCEEKPTGHRYEQRVKPGENQAAVCGICGKPARFDRLFWIVTGGHFGGDSYKATRWTGGPNKNAIEAVSAKAAISIQTVRDAETDEELNP